MSAGQPYNQSAPKRAASESGPRVSDVIGRSKVKDHPCGSIQYRLYSRWWYAGRPTSNSYHKI